jgi:diacylglycerol kinase family enzyme
MQPPSRPLVGVLVNPRARRHRRDPAVARRLASALGEHGVLREVDSLEALDRAVAEMIATGVTHLAVSGGDGTLGTTLTAYARALSAARPPSESVADEDDRATPSRQFALPIVIPLRGGTMNTIANALGVRRISPERLLAHALRTLRDGVELTCLERPTLDVGGRLGFLFGTGVFASFLDAYYAHGPNPTALTAARTLAGLAASVLVRGPRARRLTRPIDVAIEAPGFAHVGRCIAIAAGVVDQVGLGFRPFPRAFSRTDAFELLALRTSPLRTVAILPRVRMGLPLKEPHATCALVSAATLRTRDGAPLHYMVDGDLADVPEGVLPLAVGPRVRIAVV